MTLVICEPPCAVVDGERNPDHELGTFCSSNLLAWIDWIALFYPSYRPDTLLQRQRPTPCRSAGMVFSKLYDAGVKFNV